MCVFLSLTHTPLHNQKPVPGCREKREFIKLSHPRWAAEKMEGGGEGGEMGRRRRMRAKMVRNEGGRQEKRRNGEKVESFHRLMKRRGGGQS